MTHCRWIMCALAVRVRDAVPVLIVEGKPQAQGDDRASHHLAIALNPAGSTGLSPFRVKVINTAQFADPSEGDLDAFDCVFLCDVDRLSERKIEKLENFLKRGGGVVFCLGGQLDREAYDRLLYKKGEGLLPARLLGPQRAGPDQFFTFTADEENFMQPPLGAFAADSDRATLLGRTSASICESSCRPNRRRNDCCRFFPPTIRKPDRNRLPIRRCWNGRDIAAGSY